MIKDFSNRYCLVCSQAVTVLALLSTFGAAAAIDTTVGIGVGITHSDNVTRSDDNPQSDVERELRLDLGVTGNTAQFDTELAYALSARDFKNNLQADDEVVDGNARILWTPLANRFSWELTNNVSDSVSNTRLADTPDNRQQRNIIATGPNFIFALSPVDRFNAELRYVDVKVEQVGNDAAAGQTQPGSDSERKVGRLRWTHRLSAVSDLMVSTEYEAVAAATDVVYKRLLVGYGARLRNGSYEIFVGANRVKPDFREEFDASTVQAAVTYDFGGHGFSITLVKELTDTSVGLGTNSLRDESFNPSDSNFGEFDIVERQRADITYQNTLICGGCSLRMSAFIDEQEYQDRPQDRNPLAQPGDQKLYGFTLGLVYALTANIDLLANTRFEVSDFVDDPNGLEYETSERVLGVEYNVVRNLFIGLHVTQTTRDATAVSQTTSDVTSDYDELRGGLDLRYIF